MAGAIAGTAILHCTRSRSLDVVTVTINNACNLRCPHCYLQLQASDVFDSRIVDAVIGSPCRHVAIVGKEPFASREATRRTATLVHAARTAKKTVSVITNGVTLAQVPQEILSQLAYLDVSFDGGPQTYRTYRGGNYREVIRGIHHAIQAGVRDINALQVLNDRTVPHIEDMMTIAHDADFTNIMFSLYVETDVDGDIDVRAVSLTEALDALRSSQGFMKTDRAFLLIDAVDRTTETAARRLLAETELPAMKVRLVAGDPLLYGILRVTYDGRVLTPLDSLHTRRYEASGTSLANNPDLHSVYSTYLTQLDAA